jgi:hypothetical protein
MPNRLVLLDTVTVGERFEIAVFAINGPISVAPANFLLFRAAKVEFYRRDSWLREQMSQTSVYAITVPRRAGPPNRRLEMQPRNLRGAAHHWGLSR